MAAAAFGQNGVIASVEFFKGFLIQNPFELAALVGLDQETAQFIGPGLPAVLPRGISIPANDARCRARAGNPHK
jgi:hypothetical protein